MPVFRSNITLKNVDKLKVLWKMKTHSYVTAQPLYYNNKIYVSDWQGYIYCFKAKTGELIFEKQLYIPPKQNEIARKIPVINLFNEPFPYSWNGFAGTGYINEGIWFLTSVGGKEGGPLTNGAPGKIYAFSLHKNELLWESILNNEIYSGSLATPVCDDKYVFAGTCSVEEVVSVVNKLLFKKFIPKCVGEVFCFDKYSGKKKWSIKTTDLLKNDMKDARGIGVWGGLELLSNKTLFFGTGNNYGQPTSESSDSIFCVNSVDGKLHWHFQAVSRDAWLPLKRVGPDSDFGCTPLAFPCSKSGSGIAIGAGNKNGYLYAFDSGNGRVLWQTYCHLNSTPEDGIRSNITYLSGRIYIWSKNKKPGKTMSVNCINAENGDIIWNKIIHGTNTMTTGAVTNNLYFLANYSGEIYALNINNGEKVWSDQLKGASFGSSIGIYNNCIYAGTGVPEMYGGSSSVAEVVCYGIS